ncbi:MAG: glycine zipper 2TM domain-containing protein [Burkholderiales bacterium]
MDAHPAVSPSTAMHPMIMIAAIAVTLFSAAGIAAIMGWIPTSKSDDANRAVKTELSAVEQAPAPVLPAAETASKAIEQPTAAPVPAPRPAQAPAPKPRPTVRAEPSPPAKTVAVAEPTPAPVYQPAPPPAPAPRAICYDCGTIESVRQVATAGEGTGFGAIAGAVGGGVLGHQVGNGRGRDVGTVIGAIGGAIAGHQVEKHVRKSSSYVIDVRMDDGSVKSFTQEAAPAWRNGDRVRTQNGVLTGAS